MDTGLIAVRKAIEFGMPDHIPATMVIQKRRPRTWWASLCLAQGRVHRRHLHHEWGSWCGQHAGTRLPRRLPPDPGLKDYERYEFPDVELAKQEITRAHEARLAKVATPAGGLDSGSFA